MENFIFLCSESSDLLTFANPSGRYCFKRLPYGIHILQEKFFRGKLFQLFIYQAVRIPKTTSKYGGKLYRNMTNAWEKFSWR